MRTRFPLTIERVGHLFVSCCSNDTCITYEGRRCFNSPTKDTQPEGSLLYRNGAYTLLLQTITCPTDVIATVGIWACRISRKLRNSVQSSSLLAQTFQEEYHEFPSALSSDWMTMEMKAVRFIVTSVTVLPVDAVWLLRRRESSAAPLWLLSDMSHTDGMALLCTGRAIALSSCDTCGLTARVWARKRKPPRGS